MMISGILLRPESSNCLGSYRNEPTISRAGLLPAVNLRLYGAPIFCGWISIDTQNRFS